MKKAKQITTPEVSTKELSQLLATIALSETYLNIDTLITKFEVMIKAFRLKIASLNYNKLECPTQTAKLIRSIELHNIEKVFWRQELKQIVVDENMKQYYNKLDEYRLKF